jgi:hypothetical protein
MLRHPDDATLRRVASAFAVSGCYVAAAPYGNGHINDTFAAAFEGDGTLRRYIVQRINDSVFREPIKVMENIERVTAHLRRRALDLGLPEIERRVLNLVPAHDGRSYCVDDDGHVWRCYVFVEGATSYDVLNGPRQAFEGARAFGVFQRLLADYAGPRLHETIPRFHDTPSRVRALVDAIDRDALNRASGARREIDCALVHEPLASALLALRDRGAVPERITHNDTKLNNVLLDDANGEGICVVDLDTVMPGLSLFDFGDMVRTATSPVAEDHPDPSAVRVQAPMFAALARGYLEGVGGAMLPVEREHLVTAGKLLTYECGVRFLTDHLDGDAYFRAHRENHNLARARTQLALLRSLVQHEDELQRIVAALG